MEQVAFLTYLFIVGLSLSLCFKERLPYKFLILGSFLWGSVAFAFALLILYIFGVVFSPNGFYLFMVVLLSIPLSIYWFRRKSKFSHNDLTFLVIVFINFVILNIVFVIFNFTLATLDSFGIFNGARSIAYYGFNNNVLIQLSSRGNFIPLLQSASVHFGFDYLVSLQFSFSVSFISLFVYLCQDFLAEVTNRKKFSRLIVLLITFLLISTPMILILSFYIHSNLTTGFFLFLGAILGWLGLKEKNNSWFVFANLAFLGVNMSRTESFIYSTTVIILLLLASDQKYTHKVLTMIPSIIWQIIWFVYLRFQLLESSSVLASQTTPILNDSDILNPQKIQITIYLLLAVVILILSSKFRVVRERIFPLANTYFLIPFFIILISLIILKPEHMGISIRNFLLNTFFAGNWGGGFWIITIGVLLYLFSQKHSFESYIVKNLISIIILIIGLSFLRVPFRLLWSDSANRLMTFGIPFGLLLLAILLGRLSEKIPAVELVEKSNQENSNGQ